jgi:hypothetical protein
MWGVLIAACAKPFAEQSGFLEEEVRAFLTHNARCSVAPVVCSAPEEPHTDSIPTPAAPFPSDMTQLFAR